EESRQSCVCAVCFRLPGLQGCSGIHERTGRAAEEPRLTMFLPQVDVCEQMTEFVILVDMPGVDRRDVRISWKDNVLTVSGYKRQHCEPGARFMCVERGYGP